MGILTEADAQLLPLALRANGGFHHAASWYLRGWEPLWYQYYFHQATQPNTCFHRWHRFGQNHQCRRVLHDRLYLNSLLPGLEYFCHGETG